MWLGLEGPGGAHHVSCYPFDAGGGRGGDSGGVGRTGGRRDGDGESDPAAGVIFEDCQPEPADSARDTSSLFGLVTDPDTIVRIGPMPDE